MDDDPSYEITVTLPDGGASVIDWAHIDGAALQTSVAAVLRRHGVRRARIGLAVVDDEMIARLNRTHLGHEGPTDVITFEMGDDKGANRIEGEIAISAQTAAREAAARGHDTAAELALYAVHGVLHLLGYDDHNHEEACRMHSVENKILTSMGFGAVYGALQG